MAKERSTQAGLSMEGVILRNRLICSSVFSAPVRIDLAGEIAPVSTEWGKKTHHSSKFVVPVDVPPGSREAGKKLKGHKCEYFTATTTKGTNKLHVSEQEGPKIKGRERGVIGTDTIIETKTDRTVQR